MTDPPSAKQPPAPRWGHLHPDAPHPEPDASDATRPAPLPAEDPAPVDPADHTIPYRQTPRWGALPRPEDRVSPESGDPCSHGGAPPHRTVREERNATRPPATRPRVPRRATPDGDAPISPPPPPPPRVATTEDEPPPPAAAIRSRSTAPAPSPRRRWILAIPALAVVAAAAAAVWLLAGSDDADDADVADRPSPTTTAASDGIDDAPATTAPASSPSVQTPPPTEAPVTSAPPPTDAPATSTPPPTVAPTSIPTTPAVPSFGPGPQVVGRDIEPGLYLAEDVSGCSWSRRSSLEESDAAIIASATVEGRALVQIDETDAAFVSEACGDWNLAVASVPGAPLSAVGDGYWRVGVDIEPGRWSSERGVSGCYWERLSGFGGESDEVITFGLVEGGIVIDIPPADVGFTSSGCGTWERSGQAR